MRKGTKPCNSAEICQYIEKKSAKFLICGGKSSLFVAVFIKCHETVPKTLLFCGGHVPKLFHQCSENVAQMFLSCGE